VNARPKVLRIIARLNVGGPARHVTIADRGLRGRGFHTLLAHGEIGPGESSLEHLVEAAGIPSRRIRGLGRRVSPLSDLRALLSLLRLVFSVRPDVIHTHTAKAGTLGRIAAFSYNLTRPRSQRCLVVHTFHGHVLHGYFGAAASLAVRLIERALGALTDCVLVLSERQRRDIADTYRIARPASVRIVPLGLDLEPLLALPPGSPVEPDDVVFGYVGRFVPIKNLPMLIEAFAAVNREAPRARLQLIGDGEAKPQLESMVRERGLEGTVEFRGWREDLARVYQEINVLVLTSLNEGTPVAVIEAMAAGLPVIATDVGGVADVITHGRTGVLVTPGSADQLSSAMLALHRCSEERQRLGSAARMAVMERFGAARLVSDLARLYESELAAKRSGTVPGGARSRKI
jgi:glycosyltransferase involved in cell wall biosynthesis